MKRITLHVDESLVDIADEVVLQTTKNEDVPQIDSRAALLRLVTRIGFEELQDRGVIETDSGKIEGEELVELIPNELILEYRKDKHKQSGKPLFTGSKIAERFREKADQLFEGEPGEKATPETVRAIGDHYLDELEDYDELDILDESSIRRQRQSIEETIERYEREYNSAEFAPTETMRQTPDEARIGSEVKRLSERREDFIDRLRDMASTDRFTNPEDLMKALAYDHGVSLEAVELVINEITPDGTDGRQSLKSGSGVDVPELTVGEEPELEEREISVAEDSEETRTGALIADGAVGDMSAEELEAHLRSE